MQVPTDVVVVTEDDLVSPLPGLPARFLAAALAEGVDLPFRPWSRRRTGSPLGRFGNATHAPPPPHPPVSTGTVRSERPAPS